MQLKQISLIELLTCLKRHTITFLSYGPFGLFYLFLLHVKSYSHPVHSVTLTGT